MGTLYLLVAKVKNGGYIPFFITERKRSEAALIQVIQETYIQGVSTRKIEKLTQKLGIENLSQPGRLRPPCQHLLDGICGRLVRLEGLSQ